MICRHALIGLLLLISYGLGLQPSAVAKSWFKTPRVFIDHAIAAHQKIELKVEDAHYLTRVMRIRNGGLFRVFNSKYGEYLASLHCPDDRNAVAAAVVSSTQTCPPYFNQFKVELELAFAALKRDRVKFIIEKATEVGVSKLSPLITDLTQQGNADQFASGSAHWQKSMIQAVEQCERLDIPELGVLQQFPGFLQSSKNDDECWTLCCCERPYQKSKRVPILSALDELSSTTGTVSPRKIRLVVGPEGGFSDTEASAIDDFVQNSKRVSRVVSLGSTILRSETAAITGLAAVSNWLHSKAQVP